MKNDMEKRTQQFHVVVSPFEMRAINSLLAYYNSVLHKSISLCELVRRCLIHDFFAHQEECVKFAEEMNRSKTSC